MRRVGVLGGTRGRTGGGLMRMRVYVLHETLRLARGTVPAGYDHVLPSPATVRRLAALAVR